MKYTHDLVSYQCLIDDAREQLEQAILSIGASFVVWGSFSTPEKLKENYLRTKNRVDLLDRRRTEKSIHKEDSEFLQLVEQAVRDAFKHKTWQESRNRQPLLRTTVVSYCSAMEDFLKRVGIAFNALERRHPNDTDKPFNRHELNKASLNVGKAWRALDRSEGFRAKIFFDDHISTKNPDPSQYRMSDDIPAWSVCEAAFQLRNAIIHSVARPRHRITIGEEIFYEGEELRITSKTTANIATAVATIFRIEPDLDIL